MTRYIAAVDIGTTAVKALLVDELGQVSHPVSRPLQAPHGVDGAVTQDPGDWFGAVAAVAAAWWSAGISPASIACIAACGQMQNLVAIDAGGEIVAPAVLYADRGAVAEAAAIEALLGRERLIDRLGNPIDAGSIPAKWLRWRGAEPALAARTAHLLLGAKDAVVHCLTGARVVDPTTASTTGFFRLFEGVWDAELLEALAIDAALLPRIAPAGEPVGGVHATAAKATGFAEGTTVLCGMGDAAASGEGARLAAGTGADEHLYLGTSAWLSCTVPKARIAAPAGVFRLAGVDPDRTVRIAPVLNGGNVLAWALRLLGHVPGTATGPFHARLAAIAEPVDGRRHQPLFLPFLTSERCPIGTHGPGGAFVGIGAGTTVDDMLRAVLDGTALSLRWCGELLDLAPSRQPLPVLGGGIRNRAWLQVIADALDRPLQPLPGGDHLTGLGVAALAARSLGWASLRAESFADLLAATNVPVVAPGPAGISRLSAAYPGFREAAQALAGLRGPP